MRVFLFPLALLTVFSAFAADPHFGSSTITAGVGGAFPTSGYLTYPFHNGVSFVGEYEFGLRKYVAATVGVENFLLNYDNYSRYGTDTTLERVTLMPFGLRATLPLHDGRMELFAGSGAALLRSSTYDLGSSGYGNSLLWQLNGGARIALDHAERFRIGPTVRYYRDLGRPTQQWISITADFSYRFGR